MIVAAVEVEAHSGATVLDQKDHHGQERPDRTSEIVAEVADLEEGKETFSRTVFFPRKISSSAFLFIKFHKYLPFLQ